MAKAANTSVAECCFKNTVDKMISGGQDVGADADGPVFFQSAAVGDGDRCAQ